MLIVFLSSATNGGINHLPCFETFLRSFLGSLHPAMSSSWSLYLMLAALICLHPSVVSGQGIFECLDTGFVHHLLVLLQTQCVAFPISFSSCKDLDLPSLVRSAWDFPVKLDQLQGTIVFFIVVPL